MFKRITIIYICVQLWFLTSKSKSHDFLWHWRWNPEVAGAWDIPISKKNHGLRPNCHNLSPKTLNKNSWCFFDLVGSHGTPPQFQYVLVDFPPIKRTCCKSIAMVLISCHAYSLDLMSPLEKCSAGRKSTRKLDWLFQTNFRFFFSVVSPIFFRMVFVITIDVVMICCRFWFSKSTGHDLFSSGFPWAELPVRWRIRVRWRINISLANHQGEMRSSHYHLWQGLIETHSFTTCSCWVSQKGVYLLQPAFVPWEKNDNSSRLRSACFSVKLMFPSTSSNRKIQRKLFCSCGSELNVSRHNWLTQAKTIRPILPYP